MDLTVAWAAIIALGVLMYVVLDGFDLGIGILFPFFPGEHDRDVMMNTVAPVWDGNETWLVLGGAGLFAAFPMLYSTVLSALYLPLVLMLACLIFRGVSFEIRAKASRTKHLWDLAFIGGSAGATFFQGVALGAFLDGIPVADGRFSGDAFGWFTPFSMFTGVALVVTYGLLGCCWLIAEDRGRSATAFLSDRVAAHRAATRDDRRRQRLDAVSGSGHRDEVVRFADVLSAAAGAGAGGRVRVDHAALDPLAARDAAVFDGARVRAAWVCRARREHFTG